MILEDRAKNIEQNNDNKNTPEKGPLNFILGSVNLPDSLLTHPC